MKGRLRFMLLLAVITSLLSNLVSAATKLSDLTGNEWVKFMANTLMLGAILFLIYIYAVPSEKEDNTKKFMIIAAALVVCGLLAYQFMTDIWFWQLAFMKNIIHKKVLINIGVSAAVLFALMTLAQTLSDKFKAQMDKTAGKYAAIVIVGIICFNIALAPFYEKGTTKTWDEVEPTYQYVWQKEYVQELKLYTLGDSTCQYQGKSYCYYELGKATTGKPYGYGILRPPYVIVFFLAGLLIYWGLTTFKFMTDIKWMQIVFSIILAGGFANNGLDMKQFAFIGQIAAIMIMQKSLRTADSNMKPFVAWASSLFVVGAMSYYIFPDYALPTVGWIFDKGFFWSAGIFLGIAVLGYFGVKAVKGKEGEKKESRWKYDMKIAIRNKLKKGLLGSKRFKGFSRFVDQTVTPLKSSQASDEINSVFKEMNVEFEALMNYMLRLEVYGGKLSTIVGAEKDVNETYAKMVGSAHSFQSIHAEFSMYKWGTGFIGSWDPKKATPIAVAERPTFSRNCNSQRVGIAGGKNNLAGSLTGYWLFYNAFKVLCSAETGWLFGSSAFQPKTSQKWNELNEAITNTWGTIIDTDWANYKKIMLDENPKSPSRLKRYSMVSKIHSWRSMILDQYRMAGKYDHRYLFVHPKATYEYKQFSTLNPEGAKNAKWIKTSNKIGFIPSGIDGALSGSYSPSKMKGLFKSHFPFDMSKTGIIMQDLNTAWEKLERIKHAQAQGKPPAESDKTTIIRRVSPESVIMGDFSKILNWQHIEWQAFVDDLRDGRHHPFSRTAGDYAEAHSKYDFSYDDVKHTTGQVNRRNPSFDREKLKDTAGTFIGRKQYWSLTTDINKIGQKMREPHISTLGLTLYLKNTVMKLVENNKLAEQQLQRYIYDSSQDKAMFIRNPTEVAES